ncbi:OadG family transporter subunit [Marinobacteraceae bacterium S3BR75-40.1]
MTELMNGALELTVVGMGFVFAFLVVLIVAMTVMSRVVMRFAPETPATPVKKPATGGGRQAPAPVDSDTAEAIKIAINKYRSRHKK